MKFRIPRDRSQRSAEPAADEDSPGRTDVQEPPFPPRPDALPPPPEEPEDPPGEPDAPRRAQAPDADPGGEPPAFPRPRNRPKAPRLRPSGPPDPAEDAGDAAPWPVLGGARLPDWREGPKPLPEPVQDAGPAPGGDGGEKPAADDQAEFKDHGDEKAWDEDEPRRRWRDAFTRGDRTPGDVLRDAADEGRDDFAEARGAAAELADETRRRFGPDPRNSRPAYRGGPVLRQTPRQWWNSVPAARKHLAYNGTALGIGWYAGLPQYVTLQVGRLADTYDSWREPGATAWCLVVVVAWWSDRATRHWWWPFALLARVPGISVFVGVLLYGSTALPT